MKISEINPFVRFADTVISSDWKENVSTYDHRLFFVTDGRAKLYINGREYNAEENAVFLWQSGTVYRFIIEKPLTLISVNFDYTQKNSEKKNFFPLMKPNDENNAKVCEKITFSDGEKLNNPIVLYGMEELLPKLDSLIAEHEKKLLFSEEICSALMKEIIVHILRASSFSTLQSFGKAQKIIEYIEKNFSKNISNTDAAREIGYHPYHINRLLKSCADTTFHKYLLNVRLKKAQNYLINTSLCVYEIAVMCGFESAYYFTNVFKKRYGVTPTEFRKHRKNKI